MKFCSCNVNKVWYTFGFFLVLYVIFLPLKRLRTWINYTVIFKLNFEYFMFRKKYVLYLCCPCALAQACEVNCLFVWNSKDWSTTEDLRMLRGKDLPFLLPIHWRILYVIARIHLIKNKLGSWKFDHDFGQHHFNPPPSKKKKEKRKKYIFVLKKIAKP